MDTSGVVDTITKENSLVAFELLIIIALFFVVKTLYHRNIAQGDANAKALTDSTIAINNNTNALNALKEQLERS